MLRSGERFRTSTSWVSSRHSFSFGAHYDPANVGFGPLLVHNEEQVAAGTGFDLHPHRDAEIVTWVLSGALAHTDTEGRSGVVHPGLAQRMSAGRGISHAERADAYRDASGWRLDPDRVTEPVHFVQMWLRPDEPGREPSYAQRLVADADLAAGWVPVASGRHPDAAIDLGAEGSTLWVTRLGTGERRVLPEAPRVHLFVARGAVGVEGAGRLDSGDSLRVEGPAALRLTGRRDSELLVWELR